MTPSRGVTPEEKNCVDKFTKNSGETRSDRYNGGGNTLQGGDSRLKSIKNDSDRQKGRQFFRRK